MAGHFGDGPDHVYEPVVQVHRVEAQTGERRTRHQRPVPLRPDCRKKLLPNFVSRQQPLIGVPRPPLGERTPAVGSAPIKRVPDLLVQVHELDGYPVEGVADPIGWLRPATLVEAWAGELSGSIVGHALVTSPTESDDAAALWAKQSGQPASDALVFARLFVGPAGRRHGVGEQLVRAAMADAKEQARSLVLDVMDKNQAAIRLYERLGWQHIGTATHRFGEGQSITALCYVAPS